MDTGFGAEAFFSKGLGVEGEVAYCDPDWNFDSSGMGVGSADLTYRFPARGSRVEPFAAGGFSLYFSGRHLECSSLGPCNIPYYGLAYGYNLGGGVNVWLRRRLALRLGVRYQGHAQNLISFTRHFVAFRVGVTFR